MMILTLGTSSSPNFHEENFIYIAYVKNFHKFQLIDGRYFLENFISLAHVEIFQLIDVGLLIKPVLENYKYSVIFLSKAW